MFTICTTKHFRENHEIIVSMDIDHNGGVCVYIHRALTIVETEQITDTICESLGITDALFYKRISAYIYFVSQNEDDINIEDDEISMNIYFI